MNVYKFPGMLNFNKVIYAVKPAARQIRLLKLDSKPWASLVPDAAQIKKWGAKLSIKG